MSVELEGRVRGSLLGGALGDALGAPIEFMRIDEIRARHGSGGLRQLVSSYGHVGAITDDTQMTLFTAEGMLRAHNRFLGKGMADIPAVVWHAYLRWLLTQGETPADERFVEGSEPWPDGWLITVPELHARRAPGNTCLSALKGARPGSVDEPINDSKGCGAVMRAAPIGMLGLADPFKSGCQIGALTHGHPSGYLTSGYLAQLISALILGADLKDAAGVTLERLRLEPDADESASAVETAITLASQGRPSAERVALLGEGWVAEEALAIALYCALVADDPFEAIVLAANHSGDTDSTAAITGNIVGAAYGGEALPGDMLEQLELREVIEQMAADMVRHHEPYESNHPFDVEIPDWDRYPGW